MAKKDYRNRIRVVLSEKEVTNRTLAERLDVSEMTVSRWVTNKIQPSMSQFIEISKTLNVDIRELMEVDPLEISGNASQEQQNKN
ncbi:MAG: helix-turn-helix transcriptional regulator [Bacteroidales bacterium]|nr:helix-turn-helix transcriptional regulator [Bacteroidales bacterium]